MEFMDRDGRVDQKMLGGSLAAMHRATPAVRRGGQAGPRSGVAAGPAAHRAGLRPWAGQWHEDASTRPAQDTKAAAGYFGFQVDNSIGGSPQRNTWTQSWPDFFREHRLQPQLEASGSAELQRLAEPLLESLDRLFAGITLCPALLHGDLWSGNVAGSGQGPVVFDPATYYGHAEAEFGMSWCAGFGRDFWEAYHAVLPRDPGWEGRQELYTLYHKLVGDQGYMGYEDPSIAGLESSLVPAGKGISLCEPSGICVNAKGDCYGRWSSLSEAGVVVPAHAATDALITRKRRACRCGLLHPPQNHYNLFGSGYLSDCQQLLRSLACRVAA